jgi:hypothetical protein
MPAKKSGRSVKRKKNSNADVMYCIYVCPCVSCSVVISFTCTSVRSHPDSKEGVRCETRSWDKLRDTGCDVATGNTFGEGDQEEAQSKPGSRP